MKRAAGVPAQAGYLPRVLALATAMHVRPGELVEIVVRHDAECALLHGGWRCCCNPDIELLRAERAS